MKKWSAMLLSIFLVTALCTSPAWAADKTTYTPPEGTTVIGSYDPMIALGFDLSALETVILPEGVTTIEASAFSSCPNLKSVELPSTLETIGNAAFNGCKSLKTITLPEGLTSLGDNVFYGCTGLESIILPEGLTSIGKNAFSGCTNLKYVELPSTLTTIPEALFSELTSLETVILSEGITTIGPSAFFQCTGLKNVTLPSTLKLIDASAFSGCTSLESILLPEGLETINTHAFWNCGLTSVTIPKSITNWGDGTFAKCTDLTQVTLSQGLTDIGNSAFYNCPGLTSITIPDSVTSIGNYAFRATGLTEVTIPKSVTQLGEYPFGVAGLGKDDFRWVTDFKITSYAGTEAEAYAKDIGFPFVDLTPPASKPSSSSRHAHRWDNGVITVEPTDLTSGLRKYTCKSCGATKTESISAGWAAPVKGSTVTITGTPNSNDPVSGLRVISSTGTNPDAQGGQAYASTQSVEVDGKAVEFQMYALKDEKGNDTNYIKLRDVALTINGTDAQCSVDWLDGYVTVTTRTAYQPNGSEMKTPFTGDRNYSPANGVTKIDGESVLMQAFILMDDKGGGYTYYKLRDLGQALGFNVGWSAEKGIYVETNKPYDSAN